MKPEHDYRLNKPVIDSRNQSAHDQDRGSDLERGYTKEPMCDENGMMFDGQRTRGFGISGSY